ncbi:YokU family protein [Bacillus sp. JJ722]|uniref:YokU family protein n=1 Tax=Bacillus sp. JJ722 TaxID=3122973 RepID=UPI002FFEAC6A
MWCEQAGIREIEASVYWELPDGTKAIEIVAVPSYYCHNCQATYQTDQRVKEIENQLFIIDTKNIEKVISFQDLMNKPRLLKRNYFDFDY